MRRTQHYYGWRIVLALSITEMISWGSIYYGFGVILGPMGRDLGWSSTVMTGAFSLALLVAAGMSLPIGRYIDRFGARGIMTLGSIGASLLIAAWSQVHTLVGFYLIWMGFGVVMAAVLYEPAFAVVAIWFVRHRHQAMTLLTVGGGLASVVFVPLTTALISLLGWRDALLALAGIVVLVTVPLHAFVLRRHPMDLGLAPDGAEHGTPITNSDVAIGADIEVREALRDPTLWWLSAAFALNVGVTVTINIHLLHYLSLQGYDAGFGATAASLLGAVQIPSRLVIVMLGRYLSQGALVIGLSALQCCAIVLLLLWPTSEGVLLFALLFGAGSGALVPTRAALLAERYGTRNYGTIGGIVAGATTMMGAIIPLVTSLLIASPPNLQLLLPVLLFLMIIGVAATAYGWSQRATLSSADLPAATFAVNVKD